MATINLIKLDFFIFKYLRFHNLPMFNSIFKERDKRLNIGSSFWHDGGDQNIQDINQNKIHEGVLKFYDAGKTMTQTLIILTSDFIYKCKPGSEEVECESNIR